MELYIETKPVNSNPTKHQLGAFYTPDEICKRLCDWAIRTSKDSILEPSFGQCGFISASIERLRELGCTNIQNNLFGCDIDSNAFDYLIKELKIRSLDGKFIHKDFLSIRPTNFTKQKFSAVLGNPPYLPLSGMSYHQVEKGQEIVKNIKHKLTKRAGLWAYFVIHSLSFLEDYGRAAWVLPRSLIFSVYGKQLQSILAEYFKNIYIIDYMDRLFTDYGTEERTVIVLCDSFSKEKREGKIKNIYTDSIIEELSTRPLVNWLEDQRDNQIKKELENYNHLVKRSFTKNLEEIGTIKIGIVTGANKYFIISNQKAKSIGLTKRFLKPIFSRSKFVKGLKLNLQTFISEAKEDRAIYLINTLLLERKSPELFNAFTSSIPEEIKLDNKTFEKNNPWHNSDDNKIPEAFLVYMNQDGPRIILNEGKLNCTNSIHRFYFKDSQNIFYQKLICISILTSFSRISAELEGRNYGTGVLKIEPSEGKKIKVLLPEYLNNDAIEATFENINSLLIEEKTDEAQAIADNFIYSSLGILHLENEFNQLLNSFRSMRTRKKKVDNGN